MKDDKVQAPAALVVPSRIPSSILCIWLKDFLNTRFDSLNSFCIMRTDSCKCVTKSLWFLIWFLWTKYRQNIDKRSEWRENDRDRNKEKKSYTYIVYLSFCGFYNLTLIIKMPAAKMIFQTSSMGNWKSFLMNLFKRYSIRLKDQHRLNHWFISFFCFFLHKNRGFSLNSKFASFNNCWSNADKAKRNWWLDNLHSISRPLKAARKTDG